MPNNKQSAWNKLEFPSTFDKKRRAIKLGQHRERLLFTNREIDNGTPRCYHEYKLMRQKVKKHKEKEEKIHKERRERLSMLSPYSKHRGSLNVSTSCSSLQKSLSSTMSASHSISPNVSFLTREKNKTKRKKNMKYIHKNEQKSLQKSRKKMIKQSKQIKYENEKMKERLNSIRPSNYMTNIEKHWALHSHIRENMKKYKKNVQCPDIIYSSAYRKMKKKKTMQKSKSNSVPIETTTKRKHKLPKL